MRECLKHVLVLIGINIILWTPLFLNNGIIIQRDFNFPVFSENFIRYYYPTWNDYMSQPNLEQMIRLPMRLPFLLLVKAGVNVSVILKLLIVSTTILLSISMHLFLQKLTKKYNHLRVSQNVIILSSLLFAFNPVSLQFLWEISLLFSVAVLPLLLLLSLTDYDRPSKFMLKGAFLLLFSLGHPFIFIMNFIIWIIFTIITQLTLNFRNFGDIKSLFLRFIGVGLLFILLFSWYLLPYIMNPLSTVSLGRSSNLEYNTFKVVSDNNLQKILTLERDKFWYINTYDPTNFVMTLFHFLSLALVVSLALCSIIFKHNKNITTIILFFLGGYLLSTLFAFGSKSFFGEIYYLIITNFPLGWVARSPLKFQLYQMFFIFPLFCIGLDTVLKYTIFQKVRILPYTLLVCLFFGVSVYGIYDADYNSMNPIPLPPQFYDINVKLENLNDPYKVMWYPRYNERPTNWSLGHQVSPFDMKSSRKPTYNTFWNYNYINSMLYEIPYKRDLFKQEYFYTFLRAIGIKYIVFHNDRNIAKDYEFLKEISKRSVSLYSKDNWYLFSLKGEVSEPISIKQYLLGVSDTEDIYKFATPEVAVLNTSTLKNLPEITKSNILLLMSQESNITKEEIERLLQNRTIIYPFEAESDFYRSNTKVIKNINGSNGELVALNKNGKAWQNVEIVKNGTYRLALRDVGEFKVRIGDHEFILKSNSLNFTYTPLFHLTKGKYRLEVIPLNAENLVKNPSFEKVFAGFPEGWNIGNTKDFKISFDRGYEGKYSLKVSTSATKKGTWSWIGSEPINVEPKKEYLIITHMKHYNVKGSHIKIEAYYSDKNKWKQLTPFIPSGRSGNSDWQEYSAIIRIPENVTKIRVVLNAGWVLDKSKGEAITWFDDIQVIPLDEAPKLDVIWLYSTETNQTIEQLFKVKEKPAEVINYTKINPTLWKVKVNATKPFMLSFAEAYDPLWEARVYRNGEKVGVVKSIPLYSVINGFWINQTGDLEIVIRYKPQDWFELGLAISALTFAFCMFYLFYDWRKSKGDGWAKKLGKRVKDLRSKIFK